LSLAITNLAAWAGIAVTPKNLIQMNDWANERLIYTGIALGLFLLAVGMLGKKKEIKGHFEFTYKNFGTHTLFIALVCGMIRFENYELLWFLPIAAFAYYTYRDALRNRSFYFLLVLIAYAYGSASYLLLKWVAKIPGIASIMEYFTAIYTIVSTLFLVRFLMKMNKKLHK
jgi:hypothetical protein